MPRNRRPGTLYLSPERREQPPYERAPPAVVPGDLARWAKRGTLRPDLGQLVELHGAELQAIGDALLRARSERSSRTSSEPHRKPGSSGRAASGASEGRRPAR